MLLWGLLMLPYFTLAFMTGPLVAPGHASDDRWCQLIVPCFSQAMCENLRADGGVEGEFHPCPDRCTQTGFGYCFPKQTPIEIEIAIGGVNTVVDLGHYIQLAYRFAVGAAAVVSAVMFMMGGFQYMTAGGSAQRVGNAKQRIKDAIIGLVLTVGAYILLLTVNPSTLTLQAPRIPLVPPKRFIQCESFKYYERCGAPFGLKIRSGSNAAMSIEDRYEATRADDPQLVAQCVGASCTKAGQGHDGTKNCVVTGSGTAPNPIPTTGPVAPYSCVDCSGWLATCTGVGPNEKCCGGYCAATQVGAGTLGQVYLGGIAQLAGMRGRCTNGNTGIECANGFECRSGACVDLDGSNDGGFCGGSGPAAWCAEGDSRFASGCTDPYKCVDDLKGSDGTCVLPYPGSPCENRDDCANQDCSHEFSGSYGFRNSNLGARSNGLGICGGVDSLVACDSDTECSSVGPDAICWKTLGTWLTYKEKLDGSDKTGICKRGTPGSPCEPYADRVQCRSNVGQGFCCDVCIGATGDGIGLCSMPRYGSQCDSNDDCRMAGGDMRYSICSNLGPVGGRDYQRYCTAPGRAGQPCVPRDGDNCIPPTTCRGAEWSYRCFEPG